MVLLTGENIKKSYGTRIILGDISFSIHEGDKIGVIGVNGSGKSTLLRIVAGVGEADGGEIITANRMQMAYLSQNNDFDSENTVLEQVFVSENTELKLVGAYEKAIHQLELTPEDESLTKKVAELAEEMDKIQGWSLQSEAKNILTQLGITDFQKKVKTLSGGQQKRVALATALIAPVDLLILDEPTNHIDHDTVEWLEEHLEKYSKALLMVTHDRYFLDRVANTIIELEHGNLYSYEGNYTKFLEQKAEREELEKKGEQKRQNFLRTELEWVRRGAKARTTKQKARLDRYAEISGQDGLLEKENIEFSSVNTRLGKKTVEIKNISKSFGNTTYINDFSYIILRGDRLGITGKNGCGKSTLVKMIIGEIAPDSGEVELGETVQIGVFAQENDFSDLSISVLDYMREKAEVLTTATGQITASKMLEKFLFPADMQRGPVSMLSGGERRRLYLAKVLLNAPNILFLDEPTNDLDIETLRILEEYLDSFQGAVIVVSHDRYFLDRVVTRMFAFHTGGEIRQYEGGYSDFKLARGDVSDIEALPTKKAEEKSQKPEKQKAKKMSYKDQREFETIGGEIEKIERDLEKIDEEMKQSQTDYTKLQTLSEKKEALALHLDERMERWVELTDLAEEIEQAK
ncbi:MAG: ABC-F family ATP-binding cassette domain-containing protein [Bacillota bacterium]